MVRVSNRSKDDDDSERSVPGCALAGDMLMLSTSTNWKVVQTVSHLRRGDPAVDDVPAGGELRPWERFGVWR